MVNKIIQKIRKFFLFGRYCGVPFREYLTYEEIRRNSNKW